MDYIVYGSNKGHTERFSNKVVVWGVGIMLMALGCLFGFILACQYIAGHMLQ